MKTYYSPGYPVSTRGLDPTARCQDLRRRAMMCGRRRLPLMRLPEQQIDRLIVALHHPGRGIASFGGWCSDTGDGEITVSGIGGGWHRDNRLRRYLIQRGHVVAIGWVTTELCYGYPA